MRTWTAVVIALGVMLILAPSAPAQQPYPPGVTDPALAAHCMSRNPGRLDLTDEQLARIDAILHEQPQDTSERRSAILKVLTRTQWMVFWREAGIAAC
jgi:hypothetical protein